MSTWAVLVPMAIGAAGTDAADGSSSDPSTIVSIVFAVFGLLLLAIGAKNWRNRTDTSACFWAPAARSPQPRPPRGTASPSSC